MKNKLKKIRTIEILSLSLYIEIRNNKNLKIKNYVFTSNEFEIGKV